MVKKSYVKKDKVIEAAIKVVSEKSVEEATVREIAERAGVTTGTIYHYYKNKEELLYDVINHSVHFIYKITEVKEAKTKTQEELEAQIKSEVAQRLSKIEEQKLHIMLMSDILSKNGDMKEKSKTNYENIIRKSAELYYSSFGVENEKLRRSVISILIAALDGVAIQQSLSVLPEEQENFIKIFNDFFAESIPPFLEKHKLDK
ncbi:TetR/AcrR family transcriptional regulator [Clostridium omnivorum]|uniref:TetR family transcriptional regulator n=1 Tax=Clostridium omnivorum TaxID=1604902 RepID=A0ABQ5N9D6_9CLOT|nr:TetR/AcrR family transcriptional regulator [Clostridium sp. E14]GLC31802.1 TetR family transcriptional regulator [Clostridium sp. E14]